MFINSIISTWSTMTRCWKMAGSIRQRGQNRRSVRSGLTLMELLVASVLAVLLMLTLIGLLRSVARQSKLAETSAGMQPAARRLASLMQRDFVNASFLQSRPNFVRLSGPLAKSDSTGMPTFRPAEVIYRIVRDRGRTMLIRQEVQRDGPLRRSESEIAWYGAPHMEVISFSDDEDDDALSGGPPAPAGMDPMPEHVVLVVHGENGRPLFTREIFHHVEFQL